MITTLPISIDDITAASDHLMGIAHRTPVLSSRTLDERLGARVFLKCENLQRMGAFKFRGAYNRLVQLSATERARGVIAFSSGNHAQGVALAAQLLGISATTIMPITAPLAKLEATRGYGARVVTYDPKTQKREEMATALAGETGATIVPPFDDVHIMAGAGTAAKEFLEEIPDLDTLIVPVGGGGLIAGSAVAATALRPGIEVWGVEPEGADDFKRSFNTGERIEIPVPATIADGLRTTSPGALTFPVVRALVRGFINVNDRELLVAMRFAFERLKVVFEPSGAVGLAALLSGRFDARGKRVGIIISGGNADPTIFCQAITSNG